MLENMIKDQIEAKSLKTGAMGTESVSIDIELTDEQVLEFYKIDFSDNYFWEIEGNIVSITYTPMVIIRRSVFEDYCVIEYSNGVVKFSDNQETVQIKEFINAHEIVYDENQGYINIEFVD